MAVLESTPADASEYRRASVVTILTSYADS